MTGSLGMRSVLLLRKEFGARFLLMKGGEAVEAMFYSLSYSKSSWITSPEELDQVLFLSYGWYLESSSGEAVHES
ncbi:hypothetical protein F2Q68_00038551 [Brassica cretica]|uniref:Uncharacterized protein n=1 Tax=Brassica cretica TaxID=69181 RepID=A0A8S9MN22_BRACR|nr:hypothetical protein F2Q68_00038551 [Brassica cretica]